MAGDYERERAYHRKLRNEYTGRKADHEKQDAANRMWQKRSEDKAAAYAYERRRTQEAWGKSGCFPPGTSILTPKGLRDISEIHENDLVFATSTQNGRRATRKVLRKATHANQLIWQIKFHDGTSIDTTSVHSFSVNGEWKKAFEINSGDTIATYNTLEGAGEKIVTESRETSRNEDVYNLIVEGDFTFVADGVIAHSFSYFRGVRMLAWSAYTLFRQIFPADPASQRNRATDVIGHRLV